MSVSKSGILPVKLQLLHERALHRYEYDDLFLYIFFVNQNLFFLIIYNIIWESSCRGHLKLAQQICDELGVLASCVAGVDMDLKTEASLRCARTLLAANQFSQVFFYTLITNNRQYALYLTHNSNLLIIAIFNILVKK